MTPASKTKAFNFKDFEAQFPDDRACLEFIFRERWPNGPVCPECGGSAK
jgi:hypothetical protein